MMRWPEWNWQELHWQLAFAAMTFHSGHGASGWPEWEPRTEKLAKFDPQRSFDMAAVGLK
jgi:hypothetical protein